MMLMSALKAAHKQMGRASMLLMFGHEVTGWSAWAVAVALFDPGDVFVSIDKAASL